MGCVLWASYGVCFEVPNSDLYSASFTAVMDAKLCYIGHLIACKGLVYELWNIVILKYIKMMTACKGLVHELWNMVIIKYIKIKIFKHVSGWRNWHCVTLMIKLNFIIMIWSNKLWYQMQHSNGRSAEDTSCLAFTDLLSRSWKMWDPDFFKSFWPSNAIWFHRSG